MNGAALWAMIAAMGVYQGINPPMGWLYAVWCGLERGSARAVLSGTGSFAAGHYLSMLALAIPAALAFAFVHIDPLLTVPWFGIAMIMFGFYKLVRPHHPRLLARIPPSRPMSWSFAMAALHCGSPIMMLAPLASGLAPFTIHGADPATGARLFWFAGAALLVSGVMAASHFATATAIALFVHRRLGLRALTRVWIDLDAGWAVIFMLMGAMALDMSPGGVM
ncbi:MAG TPA: hypothetical protein VG848_00640 [Acetobacteraceae bacterium]|nr:hypothetical protein [Acetobacteraceae bacterium]